MPVARNRPTDARRVTRSAAGLLSVLYSAVWLGFGCQPVAPDGTFACRIEEDCPAGQHCNNGLCQRTAPANDSAAATAQGAGSLGHMVGPSAGVAATAGTRAPQAGGSVSAGAAASSAGSAAAQAGIGSAAAAGGGANQPPPAGTGLQTIAGASAATAGSTQPQAGMASTPHAGAGGVGGPGPTAGVPAPAKLQLGAGCTSGTACDSSYCVDSVCCKQSACGECERCGTTGSCEQVGSGSSDETCSGPGMSCSAGRCVLANGTKCTPSGQACASGHCENTAPAAPDAVCCAVACGSCSACAASGQRCTPISYGDDADSCSSTKSCSAGQCTDVDVDQRLPNVAHSASRADAGTFVQTFTVGLTGQLVEVRIITTCRSTISVQGVASDGKPDNVEQGSAPPLMDVDGLTAFPLRSPVRVSAGQKLALVFDHSNCESVETQRPNIYSGGQIMSGRPGNWFIEEGSLRFMTLVRR